MTRFDAVVDADVSVRLANLLAVTDERLTGLDVDDLLLEVLERLRGILDADTAAVLLHEEGTDSLVARAACGLEEEVRQGVRVPIGAGFAGRIAANRQPVRLDRVDSSTVANPILWEKGIQRMLGVPLIGGNRLLGVLHVGRLAPEDFSDEDEQLLLVASARVAAAVESRRYAVETSAAAVLERSLLPARLPDVPGLQFAARYVPAESRTIGGDWYDAFVLPDGALWIVTGDVAGHGLNAAVVMGRVKSAFRSYALLGEDPARVLELTDRKIDHFEIGSMVTMVCARAYPPYDLWNVCSAGHLPPVIGAKDAPAFVADVPPGPPLGTLPDVRRHLSSVEVPDEGVLVFYTDGLVERRLEALDEGLERLRCIVRAAHPETVCRVVMHELVGGGSPFDDIAILAARRVPISDDEVRAARVRAAAVRGSAQPDVNTKGMNVRRFPPGPQVPRAARRFALAAADPLPPEVEEALELLVSELVSNAVAHGGTDVDLSITRSEDDVLVEVSDSGAGTVAIRNPSAADPHGRGMAIVARLADEWGVRRHRGGAGKTVWFRLALAGDVFERESSAAVLESSS